MLAQLLKKKKKGPETKGKRRKEKALLLKIPRVTNSQTPSSPNFHLNRRIVQKVDFVTLGG